MDTHIQKQIDETSRYKILNNTDQNYFVEAGAGSGKTTSLVGRMVKMVEEGKDISHICAITFTKAAANEFYARYQAKLIEGSNQKDALKAERCRVALQNIDLAFMGTIDSFCNMILSEHPRLGQIPANASIMSATEQEKVYQQEYSAIMNGLYQDEELEEKSRRFLHVNKHPESDFGKILKSLLSHRDCTVQIPEYSFDSIDEMYGDTIKSIRHIFEVLCAHPEFFTGPNENERDLVIGNFDTNRYAIQYSWEDNFPYLDGILKNTLLHKNFRLISDDQVLAALGYGADYFVENSGRKKFFAFNSEKLDDLLNEINTRVYAATLDFVNTAKEKMLQRLRKQGKLTFSDYLIYLRDTLRKDAASGGKLIQHIHTRHRYYLIDEFQDTDPIQAEIFFYLAAKEVKPFWKDCIPYPGSLFIVGDPKQSIYRFKNADVASYLKIKEMFTGEVGEVLYLYCNFRSTATVRHWFNETFTRLLPCDTEEQAAYPLIPVEEREEDEFTGIYSYSVPSLSDEPSMIRNYIEQLVENENYKIKVRLKDNKYTYRTLTYKDFMIITPTKPSLSAFTEELRRGNIPYYVEGNITFTESSSFESAVKLYGAITQPMDNRYLYGSLKSSLFAFTEKELNEIHQKISLQYAEEFTGRLKETLIYLRSLSTEALNLSPSSLFARLLAEPEVYYKEGNQNMEYGFFALEVLKEKESTGEISSHKEALSFFETLLYKKNDLERCPGFEADGNKVHLANLHKVKGLEAPVVILAKPYRKEREPQFRMERSDNGNAGYLFKVSESLDGGGSYSVISTSCYPELEEREKESGAAEDLRLAYVAATRARNVLLISSKTLKSGEQSKTNPWKEMLNEGMQDFDAWLSTYPKTEFPIDIMESEEPVYSEEENCIDANREQLSAASYISCRPSAEVSENPVKEYDEETTAKEIRSLEEHHGDTLATISGTMVHRMMELIIMSKDRISKEVAVAQILNENYGDEWAEYKDDFVQMLENVYTAMHAGGFRQKGKVTQDILPVLLQADQVYCEVPFSYTEDSQYWNGIIDLIYVQDGKLHIIDWKTNKNDEGLDEHYKGQLEIYKKAVEQSSGLMVADASIYHIDIK